MKAHDKRPDSLKAYLQGFILSVLLTLAAYFLTLYQTLHGFTLVAVLMSLGVLQAIAQLIFFLHLGKERGPYWHLLTFLFMVSVLVILVAGSLWIMYELEYNVMPKM